ncbi:hypothetical protein [Xenophilus azovorans]|uniref:uracil-DNA glycosylase family protein n=1 Tax=Xenophilus azovorans TaxID=151755 RepID=UPI00057079F4|nr:hypothetical protein [Xenophilus azovorans]
MPDTERPQCAPNDYFTTDFEPHLSLPGFFPGAGGFFHSHAGGSKRILIFGTDFGPLEYQQSLAAMGGEPESNRTIANLRGILNDAAIPLRDCFLTNSVLCLGKSRTDLLGLARYWKRDPAYIEACAEWHHGFISRHRPDAVVFMGTPPLLTFGRALFPALADHWRGYKSLNATYAAGRETFHPPGGPRVLLIPHASFWHVNATKYPEVAKQAVEHLRRLARGRYGDGNGPTGPSS